MTAYSWSTNLDDIYCGQHPTREAAIAEAMEERPRATLILIGEIFETCAASYFPSAAEIIEQMGERASDDVGEAAEDWPDVSKAAEAELDAKLEALLTEWGARHGLDPTRFWTVGNIEEHAVEGAASPPDPFDGVVRYDADARERAEGPFPAGCPDCGGRCGCLVGCSSSGGPRQG